MLSKIFHSRRSKANILQYIDCLFVKKRKKVLFVVKDKTHFSGNLRIVLSMYLSKNKEKVYIYKDGILLPKLQVELESLGAIVLSKFTFYSIWHILTAGTVILSHNPRDAHITKKCKGRMIVNLWHGVAIKKIELLMSNIDKEKLILLENNSRLYDLVFASSKQDKITNSKAFGIPMEKVSICGLPRYEILKNNYICGPLLQDEENRILHIKSDKRLVLFAPTFREKNVSAIEQITATEWNELNDFAAKENIIFGIRPHPYDIKHLPPDMAKLSCFHLFENSEFTEVNILLKHTDILIVDFSSVWIDYLLLNRPIVGFAKDFTWYMEKERGCIYDFKSVFPSLFTNNINSLIEEVQTQLASNLVVEYSTAKSIFHEYTLVYSFEQKAYEVIENIRSSKV